MMRTTVALERVSYVEPGALRKASLNRRALLVGFLMPLALDVKKIGDDSGVALQALLVGTTLLCGALYIALEWLSPSCRTYKSLLRPITMAWWAYIALSPLPVLLWSVDINHYLNVLLPFVLFGVGLTIMTAIERRNIDPKVVFEVLVWGALLSTVWRAVYAVAISGLSIDTIRWQVASPAGPFLIGYGAAGLYFRKRRTLAAVALLAGAISILISVTRTSLIILILVVGGLLLIDARRRSLVRSARSSMKFLLLLATVGTVAVAVAVYARPDVLGDWTGRLTQNRTDTGMDFTLITRLAEYRGQLDALTRNAFTLLVGNGIGADYLWDSHLLAALPFQVDESARWFAGHSTWVFPFFSSGIILGAIVPIVFVSVLVRGYSASTASRSSLGDDAATAFVIYLAYFGASFTANLLHERYGALILGVVSGAILIYAAKLRSLKEQQNISRESGGLSLHR